MKIIRIFPQSDCWEVFTADGSIYIIWKETVTQMTEPVYTAFLAYLGRITKYLETTEFDLLEHGFQKRLF